MTPNMIMRLSCLLALVICVARPTFAEAAPAGSEAARSEAKALLEQGARLFEQGDFEGALIRFRAAHDRFPSPKILFNFGQAYRALGRNGEALTAFEEFLEKAADAVPSIRAEAQRYVVELEGLVGPQKPVEVRSPTSVAPSEVRPLPTPRPVPSIESPKPPNAGVPEPLLATTSSNQDGVGEPPIYARWWFWTLVGVAAAGAATVVILSRSGPNSDCLGITPCGSVH